MNIVIGLGSLSNLIIIYPPIFPHNFPSLYNFQKHKILTQHLKIYHYVLCYRIICESNAPLGFCTTQPRNFALYYEIVRDHGHVEFPHPGNSLLQI